MRGWQATTFPSRKDSECDTIEGKTLLPKMNAFGAALAMGEGPPGMGVQTQISNHPAWW